MPFTVPELDRTNALFFRAMDWTGVKENGNTTPDWWFWEYFGTVALFDTNLDSQGNTLLYDYRYGFDPNVIAFTLVATNNFVNNMDAPVQLNITQGAPSYYAVLVNDTNLADASWQPYTTSNLNVFLGPGDGVYTVSIGLRGLPANATQTWVSETLVLDTVAPVVTITNPVASSVSKPMIQLQGFVSLPLSSLTYDVSNAAGVFTNQTGYVTDEFWDTNFVAFTTNYFQCYDVALTNGLNTITLHAVDAANGLETTTNISVTVDYSGDTTPPALAVLWPTNGTVISGTNFTVQAQMDDATAAVTATITDTNGDTNVVSGLVERSGTVWIENVPLAAGTNTLTITATDAAGNSTTTNLTLVQSGVLVTMDPVTLTNQSSVSVTGAINDTNSTYDIYVNGVQAYYTDDEGDWEADGVPVSPAGTARFDVEIYVGDPARAGSQIISMAQSAMVRMFSYEKTYRSTDSYADWCKSGGPTVFDDETEDWVNGKGTDQSEATSWVGQCGRPPDFQGATFDLSSYTNGLPVTWQNQDTSSAGYGEWNMTHIRTGVEIIPSGQQSIGQSALYLVMAQVINENTGLQLAAGAVQFVNQLAGTVTEDVTNSDGSVWSEGLVSGSAGTSLEVTPQAAGNINFSQMKISQSKIIYFRVADDGNVPSGFRNNVSVVESKLYSELASNVFYNLTTDIDVKIKVGIGNMPAGNPGWDGNAKQSYINQVNFGWNNVAYDLVAERDLQGGIAINLNWFANHLTSGAASVTAQGWVNLLAHEGMGNVAVKNDCVYIPLIHDCTDYEILSGTQSYDDSNPFTVSSDSRLAILKGCGLKSN
jgi:hypothetical protein